MVATVYEQLFDDVKRSITGHGVEVRTRIMDVEKPGEFDGPTITINPKHDLESACYYLVHSFGSIYQWSTDFDQAKAVFDELRKEKTGKAIEAWRIFEQTSSKHAAWVLEDLGHASVVPAYTVFFRADIEAMTIFHRTGKEPRWPDFFAEWQQQVERGAVRVEPFRPKPVSRFRPVRIEKQEVLQERD